MTAVCRIAAEIVSEAREVSVDLMRGPLRIRRIAWPRQEAMWIARHISDLSMPVIGRWFGGRDHTTVLHALRSVESRMDADPDYGKEVEGMRQRAAGQVLGWGFCHQEIEPLTHIRPVFRTRRKVRAAA